MKILKFLVRIFYRILFKIEIEGLDKIPENEGVIIAPNHISNFDPPMLVGFLPQTIKIMGKAELFKNKLLAWFFTKVGVFPINRGDADITAIKTAMRFLKANYPVLMFPHGTRIKQGEDVGVKEGVILIALRAKKNILPAYISGTFGFRHKVTLTFGEVFDLSEYYSAKLTPEEVKALSVELWERMKALNKGL